MGLGTLGKNEMDCNYNRFNEEFEGRGKCINLNFLISLFERSFIPNSYYDKYLDDLRRN
jgi:hypothetical protein